MDRQLSSIHVLEECLKHFLAGPAQVVNARSNVGVMSGQPTEELRLILRAAEDIFGRLEESLLQHFVQLNIPETDLTAVLGKVRDVVLVSEPNFRAIISEEPFQEVMASEYPGSNGLMEFSWPAFSADGQMSLMYAAHFKSPMASTGELMLLESGPSDWRVSKKFICWET